MIKKTLSKSKQNIHQWRDELSNYSINQLMEKPIQDGWSLGQVYIHLVNSTLNFHVKQIEQCVKSDENNNKKMNFKGVIAYRILGSFPPIKIFVPPSDFYTPKQPNSKQEILDGLSLAESKLEEVSSLLISSNNQGKTPHPGFSYLNGNEWFKLIEMHFRHHLRQKDRIDAFIKK